MKVHVLQHAPFEGLGCMAAWLAARKAEISYTRFFQNTLLPPIENLNLIIVMGGPMSVNDETEFPWLVEEKSFLREAVKKTIPVLGVCLGSQLIASALGACVYRNAQKEIGWFPVEATRTDGAWFRFPEQITAFHWHGETFDLPPGATRLARSAACANQAFQIGRRTLALQCHLEVTPKAVQGFVDHCGAELQPAPYIQTATAIAAAPTTVYTEINALTERILNYLTEA